MYSSWAFQGYRMAEGEASPANYKALMPPRAI